MSQQRIMINQIEEEEQEEEEEEEAEANDNNNNSNTEAAECAAASRKERRKAAKREKRKKKRKELAEMARKEEESRLNDPEERLRLQAEEEREKLRVERERREFEERERKILEEWERRRAMEEMEEEERRRAREELLQSKQNHVGYDNEVDDDGWEYVEEGPPEIIWQGNEIIVKKKKVKVKKKERDQQIMTEDLNRPTSNPFPPQSEAFADYKNAPVLSARQLLENVAQETPNFGTEQDKAHCPFHLKTGACRFGTRCSRIHFYPDKSCTLLIKNMYNGPGLAWEQDEGLEHTDEEIEHAYEEFYEDVHTEFLKFGEIVNFKVCRNGSSHLRGNVYVHYKSLDAAVMAYQSVNGRYFAGKQLNCEFVGVTRWKVAICGEFMKSKLQTCTRGMTCNFIHCFRNPGGDYEWADWDKPPPRYWLKEMAALFGYSDELGYERKIKRESSRSLRSPSRTPKDDADRYHSRRSQSREIDYPSSSRNYDDRRSQSREIDYPSSSRNYDDIRRSGHRRCSSTDRKQREVLDDKQCHDTANYREKQHNKNASNDSDSGYGNPRNHSRSRSTKKLESRERESAHIYAEQSLSPRSDGSGEYDDKRSKRGRVHKMKHSSIGDNVGSRWDREVEHDNGKPSNRGGNYKSSDSRSRYSSREDVDDKLEWRESEHDHRKKSKRKRDGDKEFYSESRIEYPEAKRSHAVDYQMDEGTDERGRWGT